MPGADDEMWGRGPATMLAEVPCGTSLCDRSGRGGGRTPGDPDASLAIPSLSALKPMAANARPLSLSRVLRCKQVVVVGGLHACVVWLRCRDFRSCCNQDRHGHRDTATSVSGGSDQASSWVGCLQPVG